MAKLSLSRGYISSNISLSIRVVIFLAVIFRKNLWKKHQNSPKILCTQLESEYQE